MKQQISPWSIYDKSFAEKPKEKYNHKNSKTIDYSQQMDRIYDVDLLDGDSDSKNIRNTEKRVNDNKLEMHIEKLQKFNTLTHEKVTGQKILLGERHKEIIMLKIMRQQLYKEERQENQKNIVKNIIQFKDPTPDHLQFPKIGRNNQSVLLMPEPLKKYEIKRYKSRMDAERFSRNYSGLQFSDDKIMEKNMQVIKSKSKPKKLAHILLYHH